MASKPKKADLLAKCEEMGIEVPEKATVSQIAALIEAAEPSEPEIVVKTVKCDGYRAVNVRIEPSPYAPIVGELAARSEVAVEYEEDGWAKVEKGFCMAKYLV